METIAIPCDHAIGTKGGGGERGIVAVMHQLERVGPGRFRPVRRVGKSRLTMR